MRQVQTAFSTRVFLFQLCFTKFSTGQLAHIISLLCLFEAKDDADKPPYVTRKSLICSDSLAGHSACCVVMASPRSSQVPEFTPLTRSLSTFCLRRQAKTGVSASESPIPASLLIIKLPSSRASLPLTREEYSVMFVTRREEVLCVSVKPCIHVRKETYS